MAVFTIYTLMNEVYFCFGHLNAKMIYPVFSDLFFGVNNMRSPTLLSLFSELHLSNYCFRCVIAELFLEGQPPFELSQLLAYRRGQYDPSQHLEKVVSLSLSLSSCLIYTLFWSHNFLFYIIMLYL